ncbi:MAG: GTPase HflX [Myxococcales bacterium]|nr:GTPase HflX [Myxococcales bacterium]
MADKLFGNLDGLAALERDGLQRLYTYQTPPERIVGDTLGQRMTALAHAMGRQIGVLVDRRGHVSHVIVGDGSQIFLPDVGRLRASKGRLRGVRLVHVHLKGEGLTDDDLTDLARLGLDLVCAITMSSGRPHELHVAHIVPTRVGELVRDVRPYEVLAPMPWPAAFWPALEIITDLEGQLARVRPATRMADARESALLVHVGPESHVEADDRLDELAELARTARVDVLGRVVQRRRQPDRDTVLGSGRLKEVVLEAMSTDAGMLIFDHELTPAQMRGVARETEMKVLDRTQLILDIFASRARSRDGKIKVELAQLKYNLPRLSGRSDAMSRLAGGIGGVGPGETKLEVDRRRARERIHKLGQQLKRMAKGRQTRRGRRNRAGVATACLVGYTNVGKSSLLNALCKSEIFTENLLFATLSPTSRRIRLPGGTECVLTDTVGFIRDLPTELLGAFEATLEEAHEADVLILVADASHPRVEAQLKSVDRILQDHELADKPQLLVLNKIDAVTDFAAVRDLGRHRRGQLTSTIDRRGIRELMERLEQLLQRPSRHESSDGHGAEAWSPLD